MAAVFFNREAVCILIVVIIAFLVAICFTWAAVRTFSDTVPASTAFWYNVISYFSISSNEICIFLTAFIAIIEPL